MANSDIYDLVVVGAGQSGIVSARFYLDIHPDAKVGILERDHSVGGVWNQERVYPGFKSQQSVRMSGFSDVPFTPKPDQVDEMHMYKAESMTTYLDEYVDNHVYSGQTLRDRIRFGVEVASAERTPGGWRLHCSAPSGRQSFNARKLIVASGTTSEANLPEFQGRETFKGPIIHTFNLAQSKVLRREDIRRIAIIGGGKSAADHAYQAVKAGKEVQWIIRKSGKGPGAFTPVKIGIGSSIWQNVVELVNSRFLNAIFFAPSLASWGWWQTFMFSTRLGQWLYGKLEKSVIQQANDAAQYDSRPGSKPSFSKLQTKVHGLAFDVPFGCLSYDDFWDTIAPNVDVYNEDIARLDGSTIEFKNGDQVEVDAIICGTGFREGCSFFSQKDQMNLGLVHPDEWDTADMSEEWRKLDAEAEKVVRQRYYSVSPPPPVPDQLGDIIRTDTPYRLYRNIVPVSDTNHNIAFVGFGSLPNMSLASEVSAIWTTAYLDRLLKLPSEEDMKKDVAYVATYLRMRFPAYGRYGNFYAVDYHHQMDRLLGDLNLASHRKGWLHDTFAPFLPADISGLKDEYLNKYGGATVALDGQL
ncbi:uncharacterized protein PV06_06386 [Exophiala oligosperma]|uniref:Uncharacterized protein n=1 Tax=Exophiala oligosperma TaxID=215243 RepID=A0A0D2ASN0_9EURO|nr:uncharacterized protein PV06_06386 [Exophiala oligosperma]KIW42881.1 hypothetical protein PV06_06386 [Exophiala oligosperma]